ncbi:UNVERIFIED_CONTAM: Retrovirus-related Pol polyprotein from transposon TNT 1-94 [Sesamum radiatum]|uniref:Retrovirus-related Pol polyprotein from transposon TNT 1-94 n=1 Tax=Sesamum radiatum TaxID=300843 RepID=A0AAW2JVH3_SESRA
MNLGIAKHIGNKIGRFRDMETDDAGRALTEQIRLHRPILVFLSKTKCKTRRVDRLKERLNYNSIRVDSHGKGGGLMLLWWKDTEVWLQSYSEHPIDATVSRHKVWGKEGHVSLKLGVSKAYDNVEWTFLEKLIHRPKSLQQDSKVAVLITTERSWNLDMIREEFLAEDAECILSIPLSADQTKDAIVWHYGENGCFSVKSAYEENDRCWSERDIICPVGSLVDIATSIRWVGGAGAAPLRINFSTSGIRAGEVWKELEIQFMSKSIANKLYLKQRLYELKMQEGFDLVQHMNIFNQIITYLAHLDVNIEDEEKAMILLCSLPFSYEHPVTTLTYEKETIKVDEITAAHWLITSRNRRQGKVLTEIVYMLRADEKRDDSSKSANMVQNDDSDCSDGDMLSISTNQYMDAWILDSGCSYHITPNREWFSSYRSGNSGSIYLGDDRCCNIVGVGDVRIKMYDGTVRTLSDVRHIPDLKKNLISLGTLHKNDFIPKADEDRETIRIVKGALTVMKGKITAGNIYKLLGSIVVGGVHSIDSCDDNTKLWHMRLGHLSERGMTELKVWVYVLKQKSEVFAKFKLWKAEVENQTGRKIKYLRSDNGTEYIDSQFQKFCEEHGIQMHFSVRKTP